MLFTAKFCKDTANFFQQHSDTLCGSVLVCGYILEIVAMGSHPHDFHLLLGDALCEVVQEKFSF